MAPLNEGNRTVDQAKDRIQIVLPRRCLVVLSGIAASGKSTFAARLFEPTHIVSSDSCRAAISDDAHNQAASRDAFELMYEIIARRMKFGRPAVADATHLTHESRKRLLDVCGRFDYPAYLIVLDVPPDECKRRDAARTDRRVGPEVIGLHANRFCCDLDRFRAEGFRDVWVLHVGQIDHANIVFEECAAQRAVSETRPAEP